MNKKGTMAVKGFALLTAFFIFIIGLFATIEPLKEALDNARDGDALNCPGTSNFNQTAYDAQTDSEQMQKRPVCFATGITFVYFMGSFLIAALVWLSRNWK